MASRDPHQVWAIISMSNTAETATLATGSLPHEEASPLGDPVCDTAALLLSVTLPMLEEEPGGAVEAGFGCAVIDEVEGAVLTFDVGSTTVTEMGGAELTDSDVGRVPVPCGSFGLKISKASVQLAPSSAAFTVHRRYTI